MEKCLSCGSKHIVKNGSRRGKQRYWCRDCGRHQTKDGETSPPQSYKDMATALAIRGCMSLNAIADVLWITRMTVGRWISRHTSALPRFQMPAPSPEGRHIEIDEMCHYINKKANKIWFWRAIDKVKCHLLGWHISDRSDASLRTLLDKISFGSNDTAYTDYWGAYERVIASEQLVQSKKYTYQIEQTNSILRDRLAFLRRRSKVVSKSLQVIEDSINALHFYQIRENLDRLTASFREALWA